MSVEGAIDGTVDTAFAGVRDAFAANFDDPLSLTDTLRDFGKTRRWVSEVMGLRADWEAAKGLLAVGARQVRNRLPLRTTV